jgi:hypothetical protein
MTKQEILKKHGLTEQEFYAKYPTQESYMQEFGEGGTIHIKPENKGKFTAYKQRTGKTTEEALHSPDPHVRQMANFARNAAKWKHADGGMMNYYNNQINKDNALMKAGIGLAGNMIAPGLGSVVGNLFANGGELTHLPNASTHEESPYGGIPIGSNNLVEGNETIYANGGNADEKYVFSDRLKLGKKTFAQLSKEIDRRYSKRPDDKISKEAKERELSNLMQQQEMLRTNMQEAEMMANSAQMMNNFAAYGGMMHAYGGAMGKRILSGLGDEPNTLLDEEYSKKFGNTGEQRGTSDELLNRQLRFDPNSVNTEDSYGDDLINNQEMSTSTPSAGLTSMLENDAFFYNKNDPYRRHSQYVWENNEKIPKPPFKMNPYLLSGIGQGLGDLYNIYQGLRGGDPVNFKRNKYKPADPYATNRMIRDSYREANSDLATTGLSGGQYLASRMGMASNEAAKIAENNMTYDNINTQGINQTGQSNTAISNEEAIARQQERDAARNSVSMGLAGLGNKGAGIVKDTRLEKSNDAYNTAMFDILRNSHNNYEYVMDTDGKTFKLNQKVSETPGKATNKNVSAYGGKMKRYY